MRLKLTCAVLLLAAGCGTLRIDKAGLESHAPQRVAVLPFLLTEDDPSQRELQKARFVREVFDRRFVSLPYLCLRPAEVDRRLREAGYATPADVHAAPTAALGELLGVDALIVAELETLSNLEAVLLYHQVIAGKVRLLDATSGHELVYVEHSESDTGGFALEFSQAVKAIEHTLDNSSDLGFVRLAERFAESVVRKVPPPPIPPQAEQPQLGELHLVTTHDGVLRLGDEIELSITGPPGLVGTLNLGRDTRVPLVEEEPGVYVCHYDVVIGDHLDGASSVQLADAFGNAASRVLRKGELRIEARPPKPPVGLSAAAGAPGTVRLTWGVPVDGSHVQAVAFQVYGLNAQGIPHALQRVETTKAEVGGGYARFAVAGLDAYGNLGPLAVVEHEVPQ